jgi:hypothetical protein
MGRGDATYRKSQAHDILPTAPSEAARESTKALLNVGETHLERQALAQQLVDALNVTAGLGKCKIIVANRAQVHQHDGERLQSKTYGYYTCDFADSGGIINAKIRIYHLTARLKKVITAKVFLNTVLHEWVHHYDFGILELDYSPHTNGFYSRLRKLAEALDVAFVLPPERDPITGRPILRQPRPAPV